MKKIGDTHNYFCVFPAFSYANENEIDGCPHLASSFGARPPAVCPEAGHDLARFRLAIMGDFWLRT